MNAHVHRENDARSEKCEFNDTNHVLSFFNGYWRGRRGWQDKT